VYWGGGASLGKKASSVGGFVDNLFAPKTTPNILQLQYFRHYKLSICYLTIYVQGEKI